MNFPAGNKPFETINKIKKKKVGEKKALKENKMK